MIANSALIIKEICSFLPLFHNHDDTDVVSQHAIETGLKQPHIYCSFLALLLPT